MENKIIGKTIKQLADEIGVTKQAIHQKRKSKELSTSLQPFTTTLDGVIYISVDGERLIKQAFFKNEYKQIDVNNIVNDTNLIDTLVYTLQEQLKQKDIQIEKLQEENSKLIGALTDTATVLKGSQALHAKDIQLLTAIRNDEEQPQENEKKKSFFSKFRK